MPPPVFAPPRDDVSVDVQAHIRLLPPEATGKGMFLADFVKRARAVDPSADVFRRAGVAERKFVAFLDYPYADLLRLAVASARIVHPGLSDALALRRVGRTVYDTLLDSHAGRVVFGVLGVDFEKVVIYGAKGWKLTINFTNIDVAKVGPRHYRYRFRDMPVLLETLQVGVIEGAMEKCGVTGEVTIALQDLANAEIDIRWS